MHNHFSQENQQKAGQVPDQLFLPLSLITRNPDQPRLRKNNDGLMELAESIKVSGVMTPVLVCQSGTSYVLISGHRRVAAAITAGLDKIPARVFSGSVNEYLDAAISENMVRENLNPLEAALAIGKLQSRGVLKEELCAITGLSTASISELIGLNKIPAEVCHELILNGHTSKRHLIELSRFKGHKEITDAYDYFLQFKQLPKRQKRGYGPAKKKAKVQLLMDELNQSLQDSGGINDFADGMDAENFRDSIVVLLQNLKCKGWIIPIPFDASNACSGG